MGYEDIKEIKRKITERGLKVNVLTPENCTYVVERNKLRNVDEIDTLVDILASAIGAPTNPTKISNMFKSERGINYSNKTISNHIDYLVEAFLISKADRYDIKGRKYVGANLKYYFSDVGLRNARLNFRQQEPTHLSLIHISEPTRH